MKKKIKRVTYVSFKKVFVINIFHAKKILSNVPQNYNILQKNVVDEVVTLQN